VTVALRELAKCWQARRQCRDRQGVRKFYGANVRFPDKLDEVRRRFRAVKVDPWARHGSINDDG